MEALSESKGKGVLMFAQRRKRIDEIASEHEELRSKGLPVEELTEAECREAHTTYDKEKCVCNEASYAAASLKQPIEYQKNKMNHLSNVPRPLVPNRTAKPFLRFQNGTTAPVTPSAVSPVTKKNEPRFKVPAPINTSRQVWSPTGDIIASRDERICVPAIKAGILPEPKRKFISKKQSMLVRESDPHLQSKGEQKSYIESEEDCFSLGAEASNFMQPRTIKLKNPPPVPPKPTINPNCPPWRSLSSEPYIPVRSPISQPSYSSVGPHSQHYLQKQDRAQSQHMPRCSASDQTQAKFQPPTNAWAPVKSSSRLHLQPATNSWSQQPLQSPGFGRSRSLSLPRRLNSMPSPRLLSPVSTPGTQSLFLPMQRQTSFQEKVYKPPTPWEAASRSPIGSVDEAFVSQSLPSSVASNIKAAGLLKSLPEPPDELKCRVSLDPAAVSKGHYEAPSTSRTFSPEKPAFYGPPFKPAQPLWPAARATIGYMGQGSCPTVYSPLCSTVQRS
uniref:synaptopodin-2 isoform X3 n=1 Tax=Monopterus albus TaxID=43700 RepID=UPI0009B3E55A|nr:synaptopodin-2-like isoform X3 [Monopterus albus]